MNIGADGMISWAVGRITGEAQGSTRAFNVLKNPSIVTFTTPHGSTFESAFNELFEIDDKVGTLKRFEKEAKEVDVWYGNRLNEVSHDIMNLE